MSVTEIPLDAENTENTENNENTEIIPENNENTEIIEENTEPIIENSEKYTFRRNNRKCPRTKAAAGTSKKGSEAERGRSLQGKERIKESKESNNQRIKESNNQRIKESNNQRIKTSKNQSLHASNNQRIKESKALLCLKVSKSQNL